MDRTMRNALMVLAILLLAPLGMLHATDVAEPSDAGKIAQQIIETAGVRGGLIVHFGCGDGKLTVALRTNEAYLVHGLDADAGNVEEARATIRAAGLYGPVSAQQFVGRRLPYADTLVNLLVAEELGTVSLQEVLRVLVPQGVAYIKSGQRWTKTVKPRPQQLDEWTHFLHDASNNAVAHDTCVGPPRHFQWTAGPAWGRQHDHVAGVNVMVSSGGRIFHILDEAPTASILLPAKWSLLARDAMNGIVLWKRAIPNWMEPLWPLKSGPTELARRLVAVDERVFVTLGLDAPLSMLDAATGETLRTYGDTQNTEEVIFSEGMLFLLAGDRPSALGRYRVESLESRQEKARVATQWAWDERPRLLLSVRGDALQRTDLYAPA